MAAELSHTPTSRVFMYIYAVDRYFIGLKPSRIIIAIIITPRSVSLHDLPTIVWLHFGFGFACENLLSCIYIIVNRRMSNLQAYTNAFFYMLIL